jgi:ComF family protein
VIFRGLSIFSQVRAGQLLKKSAAWSSPCALCLGAAGHDRVCADCDRALPRPSAACPRCALPLPTRELCGRCLRHPPAFDATACAFEYRFPVDRLVQRFKFAGDLAIGRWLGGCLARAVADEERPDLLVAAPLSRARLAERGFNQAVVLARLVGARHCRPVDLGLVRKVRETPPQQGLARAERHANLRDAFHVRGQVRGAHVAIVDDVMTTGATAEALACALRAAGARRVDAWVLARTPEPGH